MSLPMTSRVWQRQKTSPTALLLHIILVVMAVSRCYSMQAPKGKPSDLPEGFCPKETGMATATTGECMCNWQHKDGCVGSQCEYQMGLSWYHYSCKDCKCVPEPK
mmetsp:Transcript_15312/g.22540  ORF Transcript_15312/g.22540 Transcript_15312/m.22540 type:complete len:105 (+) Transcript_15312:67-381(+)